MLYLQEAPQGREQVLHLLSSQQTQSNYCRYIFPANLHHVTAPTNRSSSRSVGTLRERLAGASTLRGNVSLRVT